MLHKPWLLYQCCCARGIWKPDKRFTLGPTLLPSGMLMRSGSRPITARDSSTTVAKRLPHSNWLPTTHSLRIAAHSFRILWSNVLHYLSKLCASGLYGSKYHSRIKIFTTMSPLLYSSSIFMDIYCKRIPEIVPHTRRWIYKSTQLDRTCCLPPKKAIRTTSRFGYLQDRVPANS